MIRWRDELATLLAFYARLPAPPRRHGLGVADSVGMLPIAAVLVALPAALVLWLTAALGASPFLAAVLATATLVAVTGALHEDGFADCVDGFWGGAVATRRLEIMRDSRIGTYGVLALVTVVLIKVALLESALAEGPFRAALIFVAAAVAGRTVALYPWVGLPNARDDGLAVAAGRPSTAAFRRALVLAVVVTLVLVGWITPLGFILGAVAAAAAAKGVASLADRLIGGHTGDVIGAAVVAGDLAYLAAITICL
ncbi:adenosylcobinamide-GDP ribazoletransferase [Acuticoccus mangrovi]|uniref:Adenosylcobinamide-GDP ribazoletransferase n=1 Tax=Acuticoccus mangrovi TaxID=2796142 RepID=A0A934IUI6_9HYPH|nr:adenosylcobinamide-GDP ribazoletransferase [Acuticoccus mangrovi]MBJ3777984.1 adenosylcobinamide-GDP ribazoletransferase [Acuticoccus mangrovi]